MVATENAIFEKPFFSDFWGLGKPSSEKKDGRRTRRKGGGRGRRGRISTTKKKRRYKWRSRR